MPNELRALRQSRNIPAPKMVAVVKRFHSTFDGPMLSKCENSDKYGVRISRKALDALYREFAPDMIPSVKRKRDGRHRLTKRVSGRLENSEHAALLEQIKAAGYATTQDWVTDMARQYIKKQKTNPEESK